ncbi:ankyrin repeat domain-containing protein 40-like [Centruroides sculpturatus]|uniref:ankyrin repeat domain-containing protein 40-like n=1 Tax=Centruroides sculpturatus TaxID=218467 RepID=UPI000C6DEE0E|nr:ankyrin repeat domain-containing protein 40-like [Centruroides sculpturatus]
MDAAKLSEEKLREASCFGDEEAVRKLIERGVNINAQHEINGCDVCSANLAITPNYIAHPPLGYKVDMSDDLGQNNQIEKPDLVNGKHPVCVNPSVPITVVENEELVLKVRLANSQDPDFIEIEIPRDQLTYNYLLQVCCIELNIDKEQILYMESCLIQSSNIDSYSVSLKYSSSINSDVCSANLAITPNYIAHPPLGYKVDMSDDLGQNNQIEKPDLVNGKHPVCVNPSVPITVVENEELVLKVRLANSQDPDFIEIEIPRDQLTYNYLLQVCCIELNIDKEQAGAMGAQAQDQDKGSSINSDVCSANLAITPNYIAHPPLGYKVDMSDDLGQNNQIEKPDLVNGKHPVCVNPSVPITVVENEELVLKVRLANSQDPDFIEIEIPRDQLTYNYLLQVCCIELNIDKEQVSRIRKLPNTVLRKDKDIQRLKNFQELEVVLTVAATTTSTQTKTVNISTTKESESSPIRNKTFLKNSSAPPPPGYLTVSNSPVTATKNVFEKSTFCKNGTILY